MSFARNVEPRLDIALAGQRRHTPLGQQVDKAVELARKVAACAPLGIQSILKSQQVLRHQGRDAAYEALLPQFGAMFRTQDFGEFLAASRERRSPKYIGH